MKHKIETKAVKHFFTNEELLSLGSEIAGKITSVAQLENDLKSVKKQYDSRIQTENAEMAGLSSKIQAKFELRPTRVFAVFRAADREKDYYAEGTDLTNQDPCPTPLLTEPMTGDDFQIDLIQAESKFDHLRRWQHHKAAVESQKEIVK